MIKLSLVAAVALAEPSVVSVPRNKYDAWYCPNFMGGVVLPLEHINLLCTEHGWTKSLDYVTGTCTFNR